MKTLLAFIVCVVPCLSTDEHCAGPEPTATSGLSMLAKHSKTMLQKRLEIPMSVSDIDEIEEEGTDPLGTTKKIQVTVENPTEVHKIGCKILGAIKADGSKPWEWVPIFHEKNLTPSEYISDNDTYPKTYTVTLNRSDEWTLDREGVDTAMCDADDTVALNKVEEEAKEIAESDPPPTASAPDDEPASLLTLSVEELEAKLSQIHDERFGAPDKAALFFSGAPDRSNMSHEALLLAVQKTRRRRKNQRQIQWAAKATTILETKACKRTANVKPGGRARPSRSVHCEWDWFDTRCWCPHWEDIGGICYEPCRSDEIGHWFVCHKHCNGGEDTGITCNERCNVDGLSHLSHTCTIDICTHEGSDCGEYFLKLALAFADALSNFIPGAQAMKAVKMAVKTGSKVLIKRAIRMAVKDVAKRLMKDAKRKLRRHMKKERKELKEELMDDIMNEGVETAAETMIAKTEGGSLKNSAMELVRAVDPTGIVGIVDAFEHDSCESKKIFDMPQEGLIEEVCLEKVTVVMGDSHWAPDWMLAGDYYYLGEDYDERPIYANDKKIYIYHFEGLWRIGPKTGTHRHSVFQRRSEGRFWCVPRDGWFMWNGMFDMEQKYHHWKFECDTGHSECRK